MNPIETAKKMMMESRRSSAREWVIFYVGLFLLIFALLFLSYVLSILIAKRGLPNPYELHILSKADWLASYHIEWDERTLPESVRQQTAGARILPVIEIGDQGMDLHIEPTSAGGKTVPIRFRIPEGTLPGWYAGTLVIESKSSDGLGQRLEFRIRALDPFSGFRLILALFVCYIIGFILLSYWMHPLPFGFFRLHDPVPESPSATDNQELIESTTRRLQLPRSKRSRVVLLLILLMGGWALWILREGSAIDPSSLYGILLLCGPYLAVILVFFWSKPFNRNVVTLHERSSSLPDGDIEFNRTSLIVGGRRHINATLRLWSPEDQQVKQFEVWPRNGGVIRTHNVLANPISTLGRRANASPVFAWLPPSINSAVSFRYFREQPKQKPATK